MKQCHQCMTRHSLPILCEFNLKPYYMKGEEPGESYILWITLYILSAWINISVIHYEMGYRAM